MQRTHYERLSAQDAARITAAYAASLDRVERYRQRLAYIPFFELRDDEPRATSDVTSVSVERFKTGVLPA